MESELTIAAGMMVTALGIFKVLENLVWGKKSKCSFRAADHESITRINTNIHSIIEEIGKIEDRINALKTENKIDANRLENKIDALVRSVDIANQKLDRR